MVLLVLVGGWKKHSFLPPCHRLESTGLELVPLFRLLQSNGARAILGSPYGVFFQSRPFWVSGVVAKGNQREMAAKGRSFRACLVSTKQKVRLTMIK